METRSKPIRRQSPSIQHTKIKAFNKTNAVNKNKCILTKTNEFNPSKVQSCISSLLRISQSSMCSPQASPWHLPQGVQSLDSGGQQICIQCSPGSTPFTLHQFHHSNSRGTSPVYCSFEHNSIPSPTYATICSATPQLKHIPSFCNFFATTKSEAINIFVHVVFSYDLFGV